MVAYLATYLLTTAAILITCISLRLAYILPRFRQPPSRRKRGHATNLLIVLGSGGHTAEMLAMLEKAVFGPPTNIAGPAASPKLLDWSAYTHRTWVVSSGDSFSALRAEEFEIKAGKFSPDAARGQYQVVSVPRARRIHQPLWSSPFSSLKCGWACAQLLLQSSDGFPDVILTNGPATATVLIFTSVLLRFLDVKGCHSRGKMRTIYVESWARVQAMSLSGKLLCWVADRVLVQWEQLVTRGSRAEYHGVLCF